MFDAVFNIFLGGKTVTINTCYRFNPSVWDYDNLEYFKQIQHAISITGGDSIECPRPRVVFDSS